jgi:CO dehydrogenase/acetyl-CoA synthase beta subunit
VQLFDGTIREIRAYIGEKEKTGKAKTARSTGQVEWPPAGPRDIVLSDEVGLELGRPQDFSSSFLVWTNDLSLVRDGSTTLVGYDAVGCPEKFLSFGRVVLIGGRDFDEENSSPRHGEMSFVRHEVSLKGYMVRALSRPMKEWARISKQAVDDGFSLLTLGEALIERYRRLDYVDSAEVLMVTSGIDEIDEFAEIGNRAIQYLSAVRKMGDDLDFDCDSCEYEPVCSEVGDLKSMREALQKAKNKGSG